MVIKVIDNNVLKAYQIPTSVDIAGKLDAPENSGTAGQILGLSSTLAPQWINASSATITLKTWTSADIGGGS